MFTSHPSSRPVRRPLPQNGAPPFIVRRPRVRVYALARSSSRRGWFHEGVTP
jgi:hypothetical protein